MKRSHEVLEDALETVEEQGVRLASSKTQRVLTDALDRIGQGLPGVELASVQMPSYPGLLNLWDYARDVRETLLTSLDEAVKCAEGEVRSLTTQGVQQVLALGEEHLPGGVERSRRVFIPEAMFSSRRTRDGKRTIRQNSCVVAGGTLGLGIGLAARSEICQPTFFDIFDVPHYFWLCFGDCKVDGEDESGSNALSLMSVGVGAVTMIGGRVVGTRAFVEGVARITDVLSHETARKWVPPVFGALIMGATTYLVLGLPKSVPRTVGRRIRNALLIKPENSQGRTQEELFVDAHAERVARETRKVLRLAAWDLKECLRVATDERSREVRGAEEMECRALRAKEWFTGVTRRTADIREQAGLVSMS
jgi:mitofusin